MNSSAGLRLGAALIGVASIPFLLLIGHVIYVLGVTSSSNDPGVGMEVLAMLCVVGYIAMTFFNAMGASVIIWTGLRNNSRIGGTRLALIVFVGIVQVFPLLGMYLYRQISPH